MKPKRNYTTRKTKNHMLLRGLDMICFPDDERISFNPKHRVWWIMFGPNKEHVGYACAAVSKEGNYLFLVRAGIVSEHRGRNLQRRFIDVRERYAKRVGVRYVITYTTVDNYASINNLINAGYRAYEPAEKYVGTKVIYWRKDLGVNK